MLHEWYSTVVNNPAGTDWKLISSFPRPFISFVFLVRAPFLSGLAQIVDAARTYEPDDPVLDSDSRDRSLERLVCPYNLETGEEKLKSP